jgi:hypothetical protein
MGKMGGESKSIVTTLKASPRPDKVGCDENEGACSPGLLRMCHDWKMRMSMERSGKYRLSIAS